MLIHGLGISLHELPWLYKSSDLDSLGLKYQEGMVLAVENWVGDRGGTDGVRLEENVVVTKDGYDLLTKYEVDELIECPI
jgi:Xaa-Pro aminopeptidase